MGKQFIIIRQRVAILFRIIANPRRGIFGYIHKHFAAERCICIFAHRVCGHIERFAIELRALFQFAEMIGDLVQLVPIEISVLARVGIFALDAHRARQTIQNGQHGVQLFFCIHHRHGLRVGLKDRKLALLRHSSGQKHTYRQQHNQYTFHLCSSPFMRSTY